MAVRGVTDRSGHNIPAPRVEDPEREPGADTAEYTQLGRDPPPPGAKDLATEEFCEDEDNARDDVLGFLVPHGVEPHPEVPAEGNLLARAQAFSRHPHRTNSPMNHVKVEECMPDRLDFVWRTRHHSTLGVCAVGGWSEVKTAELLDVRNPTRLGDETMTFLYPGLNLRVCRQHGSLLDTSDVRRCTLFRTPVGLVEVKFGKKDARSCQ